MGQIKKAIYKVDNGTDFDTIHFETEASQVKTADGSNVETKLAGKVNSSDIGSVIQQHSNDVRTAVGQVGGINLLRMSDFGQVKSAVTPPEWIYWGSNTWTYPQQGQGQYAMPGTICIANNQATAGGLTQQGIILKPDTVYTLSYATWKEPKVTGGRCQIEYRDGKDNLVDVTYIDLNFDGNRHSFTFTTKSTFDHVFFSIVHFGSTDASGAFLIYFQYPKLEEGDIATAWSPAPSDTPDHIIRMINNTPESYRIGADKVAGMTASASYQVTVANGQTGTLQHNFGRIPIVVFSGNIGNLGLVYSANTSNVDISVYNSGGNSFTGTVYLF